MLVEKLSSVLPDLKIQKFFLCVHVLKKTDVSRKYGNCMKVWRKENIDLNYILRTTFSFTVYCVW